MEKQIKATEKEKEENREYEMEIMRTAVQTAQMAVQRFQDLHKEKVCVCNSDQKPHRNLL